MENKDNLLGVLQTLYKWRKQLLYGVGIATLGSIIIAFVLPIYYQASTTFLAGSPDRANPETLFPSAGSNKSYYYGTKEDTDRLLSIAESAELSNFLIDSFDLYSHYDIDSTAKRAPYYIKKELEDLYEVKKTKRGAIQLSIEDRDSKLAAKIANSAREKINQIAQDLVKTTQQREIQTLENDLERQFSLQVLYKDSLSVLRSKYGVFNVVTQSSALTSQKAEAEAKYSRAKARLGAFMTMSGVPRDTIRNLQASIKAFEEEAKSIGTRLDTFNRGSSLVEIMAKQYYDTNESMGEIQERLKKVRAAYDSNIPAVLILEDATEPVIKSRPNRKIIVLATIIIAFVFGIIGILLFENYQSVNWKKVLDGK